VHQILIVTSNRKKLKEMLDVFNLDYCKFLTLNDFPSINIVENGETFFDNALIKAKTAATKFNVISLGEDSGLVVDALNGKPGVYSHRFAGETATDKQNNELILSLLKDVPLEKRTAHFVSCVVLCSPDGRFITAEGRIDGIIIDEPKGENGFGYDPIFYYPPLKKTFAELTDEEKNRISHRKIAIEKIKPKLLDFLEEND